MATLPDAALSVTAAAVVTGLSEDLIRRAVAGGALGPRHVVAHRRLIAVVIECPELERWVRAGRDTESVR